MELHFGDPACNFFTASQYVIVYKTCSPASLVFEVAGTTRILELAGGRSSGIAFRL